MSKCLSLLAALFALLALVPGGSAQGEVQQLIALSVDAGYGGYFRELDWLPVRVSVTNRGPDVTGRLVVRPETSGEGITNTFSAPVVLPQGAQQTVTLYVTARSFATLVRVELLTSAGAVLTSADDRIGALRPGDRMAVVFTSAAAGSPDLSGAALGGFSLIQTDWTPEQLPPLADALAGIDLMLFDEVDSGLLTIAQHDALAGWVRAGGHLIVAGGPNWQPTAAGLTDLLPLRPEAVESIDTLEPLARWLASPPDRAALLDIPALVAVGELADDAQALVETDSGLPLIARRFIGAGLVDSLAASPSISPLRGWGGLGDLWFTLETTRGPVPGWTGGFDDWAQAQQAASIIPGMDPLPDILPLGLFMLAYVLAVGPGNYLLLSRVDKRDWAWLTIPLSIAGFTALAWLIGSNLRGADPVVNQLAAVQSWPGETRAVASGVTGLLSPRRAQYTLTAADGHSLRPIPSTTATSSLLVRGAQASVNIEQGAAFAASDFAVDASFVAGFSPSGQVDAPALSGSATLSYDPAIAGQMIARGSVRNDSDETLRAPVILARGAALQLDDLPPGGVAPFELVLAGEGPPAPAPHLPSTITPYLTFRTARGDDLSNQTAVDILDTGYLSNGSFISLVSEDDQQRLRDQLFISALVDDSFDSTGRGDALYLAGWLDSAPLPVTLNEPSAVSRAATLALAALEVTVEQPAGPVTVSSDRFTWAVRAYTGLGEAAPVDVNLQEGEEVTFRFTPLPAAVLDEVQQLSIVMTGLNVAVRRIPLYLYNWRAEDWTTVEVGREGLTLDQDFAQYLGPENAVQIRLLADDIGGYLRIGSLGIEQRGVMRGS